MPQVEIPKQLRGDKHVAAREAHVQRVQALLSDPTNYEAEISITVRDRKNGSVLATHEFKHAIQYGTWVFMHGGEDDHKRTPVNFGFDFLATRENTFQAHKVVEDRWLYGPARQILTEMMMRDQTRQAIQAGGKKVFPASVLDLPPNPK